TLQLFNSSILQSSTLQFFNSSTLSPIHSFLLNPRYQRRFIEVYPSRLHAFGMISETHFVLVPASARSWRPSELGDAGQAGEYHILNLVDGGEGFGPQRGFHAHDLFEGDITKVCFRIPVVGAVHFDI